MLHRIGLASVMTMLSFAVFAISANPLPHTQVPEEEPQIQPHNQHSDERFKKVFLRRQVDQTMSVGRAIRSIASHYPQEVVSIVDIALDTYPDSYREIIYAAISAQPAAAGEIVTLAIEKNVSNSIDIVKMAINAEPSYVDFVVQAAAHSTPEELNEIVRIAVLTEPDSADTIVQTLTKAHPNKLIEIMSTALEAVPFVGEYVVDALLAVFPSRAEAVLTTAFRSAETPQDYSNIVASAKSIGLSDAEIDKYAHAAGMMDAMTEIQK